MAEAALRLRTVGAAQSARGMWVARVTLRHGTTAAGTGAARAAATASLVAATASLAAERGGRMGTARAACECMARWVVSYASEAIPARRVSRSVEASCAVGSVAHAAACTRGGFGRSR